jgi:DNA-binding Xre family transcriptional regulator
MTTEPNIYQLITDTVEHLMVDRKERNTDLVKVLGFSQNHVSKKRISGSWTLDDLDTLASHYGYDPADIIQGYVHLRTITDPQRDPENLRDRLTATVRHLMLDHNETAEDLAVILGVRPSSFERKLTDTRWTLENVLALADHYGVEPSDIIAGYDHLLRVGTQIQDPAPENP